MEVVLTDQQAHDLELGLDTRAVEVLTPSRLRTSLTRQGSEVVDPH